MRPNSSTVRCDHARDLLLVLDVGRHRQATASVALRIAADVRSNSSTVRLRWRRRRRVRKEPCRGGADAGSATRDDGDAPGQVIELVHGCQLAIRPPAQMFYGSGVAEIGHER